MYSQRGLDRSQEQKSASLVRDVRTMGQKLNDEIFGKPAVLSGVLAVLCITAFLVPSITDILILTVIVLGLIGAMRTSVLPFRMPKHANVPDHNDLNPGTGKPKKSSGIYFFGNNKKGNNEELWFTNEDMRTHVLIFGSTGSGKTETLVSISFNALIHSSGFIYVDGKGDNSLFAKVFSMVRFMGREDDLLLINFMTGARDISGPQEKRISNTMNPFTSGSSSMLSNLVVSMMDSSSGSGDGDMWKGRAIAFVEALMKVLVTMRDAGHILLDAAIIRSYFGLDRVEAIVQDRTFIRENEYNISLEGLPEEILEPMKIYLYTLPGYNKDKKGQQVSQVFEQHGFITMQLVRVFSSLADTYGHIMRTNLAEVDLKDVVLNRRILVVLLPALEKSPDELSNLGKVIISTLKVMMASGLGDEVEGRYQDLILKKPTNSETPFLCVLDEYGYYAVKGFAVVPAQARSLGFSVIFAGQDLPAFQKASKEEAASIGANTNIKICMKLEDPQETWDFFNKTAGESYVTQVDSFSASGGSVTNSYLDSRSAKLEKRGRIDLLDLKEQREGEFHIFFKSKIIRGRSFYANPAPVKQMRLNQFLKIEVPSDADLYTLVKGIEDFELFAKKAPSEALSVSQSDLLASIASEMRQKKGWPLECALDVILDFTDKTEAIATLAASKEDDSAMHLFSSNVQLPDVSFLEGDMQPLLDRSALIDQMTYLQALITGSKEDADFFVTQLMEDMKEATYYNRHQALDSARELVPVVKRLADAIIQRKLASLDDISKE